MRQWNLAVAVAGLGGFAFAAAGDVVMSTFETGLEGWTAANNGSTGPEWVAPSSEHNGYAKLLDSSTGWGYLRAPAEYLSQAALFGGTFSFDLRHEFVGDPVAYRVRVGIVGGGLNLINESVLPTTEWASYSFTLDAISGWRVFSDLSQNYSAAAPLATEAQMQAALTNMQGLYIAADYTPSYAPADTDLTSIDNVVLDVVPAPGVATAVSVLGLMGLRRRR